MVCPARKGVKDAPTGRHDRLRPVVAGELYGPLRDVSLFNAVSVDPEVQPSE